jgi:large subunit ribosomal protein L30
MPQKWNMVFQTRSPIRRHHAQRETLIGLGLNGIRRGRVLPDKPETRGMIRKVQHLVQVFEGPHALKAPSSLIFGDYEMSMGELVEIVVYGGLTHSNPKKAKIFEAWEKLGIMGFVWAAFFAAMRDFMRMLKHLRTLNEQVLGFADPQPSNEASS